MKRAFVFSFVAVLVVAAIAFAQGKPDFSGTWVFDAARSDLKRMDSGAKQMPTRTVTLVLKQTGDTLTIQRTTGERKETAVYKLDGSESINKLPNGPEARTTVKWVGATLVGKTRVKMGDSQDGRNFEMTDIRSLSDDGRVMTVVVTRQTPKGEVRHTLVYNKQK